MQQAKLNHGHSLLCGKIKIENTNKIKYTNKVTNDIAIIGGGIAGLACAIGLESINIPYKLFEKSNELGGRVGTYTRDDLIVDKGFQVFLPHYKTCQQILNIKALDLCYYPSGAAIITDKGTKWFGHPIQYPNELKQGKK